MFQGTWRPGVFIGSPDAISERITATSFNSSEVSELAVKLQALPAPPPADE